MSNTIEEREEKETDLSGIKSTVIPLDHISSQHYISLRSLIRYLETAESFAKILRPRNEK